MIENFKLDDQYFQTILDQITKYGLDNTLYKKIAQSFTNNIEDVSKSLLISVLSEFVESKQSPIIYVNEIKIFLKINDKFLYEEYAKLFSIKRESMNLDIPQKSKSMIDEPVIKEFQKRRNVRIKKNIRKIAKKAAVEKYHQRVEQRSEKKNKIAEFEALVRKENGNN